MNKFFNFKSEQGSAELGVALFIMAIIVVGMYLQARNGSDPFTTMWAFLQSMGS